MYFKVIRSGINRKLVYDFLLVLCGPFCRITPFTRNLMWNSLMTLKYRQGHRHSYHQKQMFDFLLAISLSVDVSYIIYEILDLGGWNDLQISFKVIKSGTNRSDELAYYYFSHVTWWAQNILLPIMITLFIPLFSYENERTKRPPCVLLYQLL